MTEKQRPDRNLALELVRVTEAAALAASRWMGRGDKKGADGAAVDAMRDRARQRARWTASSSSARARRTRPRCCSTASRSATARPPLTDIAVDPIDGTTLTALGRGNAIAVDRRVASGARCSTPARASTWRRSPSGPRRAGVIDLDTLGHREPRRPWPRPRASRVRDVTAVILDRDRHDDLIAEVREAGARIRLIPDGDVAGAISTAWPDSGADILFGIGGTPEGVITAAALKCMGGEHAGPPLAPQRRRAPGRGRRRLRPRPGAHHRRPGRAATTASSPPPASPTASCSRASTTTAGAPPPSRWSCARSPAPSAASTPATGSTSCGSSAAIEFG